MNKTANVRITKTKYKFKSWRIYGVNELRLRAEQPETEIEQWLKKTDFDKINQRFLVGFNWNFFINKSITLNRKSNQVIG